MKEQLHESVKTLDSEAVLILLDEIISRLPAFSKEFGASQFEGDKGQISRRSKEHFPTLYHELQRRIKSVYATGVSVGKGEKPNFNF